MSLDQIIVFALIGVVVLAFFREWGAPDKVALLAMGAVLGFQVLDTSDVIAVFSNPAPITVACASSPMVESKRAASIPRAPCAWAITLRPSECAVSAMLSPRP